MTNQKSLDKKKTKELDWGSKFERLYWSQIKNPENFGLDFYHKLYGHFEDFIYKILTQQRTELLEEIKKINNPYPTPEPSRIGSCCYTGFNQAIEDIIRLFNKK